MKVITKPDGTVEITTYVKYYYVTEAKVKEEHIDIETGELLEDVPKTPTENNNPNKNNPDTTKNTNNSRLTQTGPNVQIIYVFHTIIF